MKDGWKNEEEKEVRKTFTGLLVRLYTCLKVQPKQRGLEKSQSAAGWFVGWLLLK